VPLLLKDKHGRSLGSGNTLEGPWSLDSADRHWLDDVQDREWAEAAGVGDSHSLDVAGRHRSDSLVEQVEE
jgi:hypothetical protein